MMNLGNVVIDYKENGDVESASFKPATQTEFDKALLGELKSISCTNDSEKLRHNAELIMSGWVSKISKIDEMDMMLFHSIKSEVVKCEKHDSGLVKHCEINFTLSDTILDN